MVSPPVFFLAFKHGARLPKPARERKVRAYLLVTRGPRRMAESRFNKALLKKGYK